MERLCKFNQEFTTKEAESSGMCVYCTINCISSQVIYYDDLIKAINQLQESNNGRSQSFSKSEILNVIESLPRFSTSKQEIIVINS